jgi:hypothetical protein
MCPILTEFNMPDCYITLPIAVRSPRFLNAFVYSLIARWSNETGILHIWLRFITLLNIEWTTDWKTDNDNSREKTSNAEYNLRQSRSGTRLFHKRESRKNKGTTIWFSSFKKYSGSQIDDEVLKKVTTGKKWLWNVFWCLAHLWTILFIIWGLFKQFYFYYKNYFNSSHFIWIFVLKLS